MEFLQKQWHLPAYVIVTGETDVQTIVARAIKTQLKQCAGCRGYGTK
jgi:hypothetical protein